MLNREFPFNLLIICKFIFFYDNFTEIFWADNSSESITTQITRPVKQKNGYSADFEISDGELTINYYKDDQELMERSEKMSSLFMDNFFVMAYIGIIITFVFLKHLKKKKYIYRKN